MSTPTLLLPHLPPTSLVGLNLQTFTTTPTFSGITNLPPGWHFVFASPTPSLSLRQGIWFHVSDPFAHGLVSALHPSSPETDLHVITWNPHTESLRPVTDTPTLQHHRRALPNLKSRLAPYTQPPPPTPSRPAPVSNDDGDLDTISNPADPDLAAEPDDLHAGYETWARLTSHVTSSLLSRLTSPPSTPSQNGGYFAIDTASTSAQDLEPIPGLAPPAPELDLLPIDLSKTWPPGAVGAERTRHARDTSWYLSHLIAAHCGDEGEVLGELQVSFIMGVTLGNASCGEGWKRILGVVTGCVSAVGARAGLFAEVLRCLRVQVEWVGEEGLVEGEVVRGGLVRFRRGMEGLRGEGRRDVVDALGEVEEYVREAYGWDVGGVEDGGSEGEDEIPVIAGMDGAGLGMGGGETRDVSLEELRDMVRTQRGAGRLKGRTRKGELREVASSGSEDEEGDEEVVHVRREGGKGGVREVGSNGSSDTAGRGLDDEEEDVEEMDVRF